MTLQDSDGSVFFDFQKIAGLNGFQKFFSEFIDSDDIALLPDAGEDDAACGQTINMFAKEEAGGIDAHRTDGLNDETAGCGTNCDW